MRTTDAELAALLREAQKVADLCAKFYDADEAPQKGDEARQAFERFGIAADELEQRARNET
jgi:hypothetical protein